MYYSGNWTAGNCDQPSSAVRGKIVPVRFPMIAGGKGDVNDFMGGVAEEFCVSARTEHPDEAFLLCRFLAENHSRNAWLSSAGIPTWKVSVDESKINPIMKEIVRMTANAKHFQLWGNTELGSGDSEFLKDTAQELLAGSISADRYCEKLQTIYTEKK
jgi:raffinose/stachyose/melibiose transport system substrate-binding protein